MKLNNKYIIGTNIMFYEIEIASEFEKSNRKRNRT